jgi:hypothetical protein
METDTCSEKTFRELAETHAINSVGLLGLSGGYVVVFHVGEAERKMASTRGGLRLFKLEAGADFLRRYGFFRFVVDIANFREGHIRKPRPDRAQALKRTKTRLRQSDFLEGVASAGKTEQKGRA